METLSIVQCRVQVVLQGRQGSLEGAVQVVLWPLTCVPKGPNVDTTTTSSFRALMGTGIKKRVHYWQLVSYVRFMLV